MRCSYTLYNYNVWMQVEHWFSCMTMNMYVYIRSVLLHLAIEILLRRLLCINSRRHWNGVSVKINWKHGFHTWTTEWKINFFARSSWPCFQNFIFIRDMAMSELVATVTARLSRLHALRYRPRRIRRSKIGSALYWKLPTAVSFCAQSRHWRHRNKWRAVRVGLVYRVG